LPGAEEVLKKIRECLVQLDKACVHSAVEDALRAGVSASSIVLGPMSRAMEEIGRLYEEGEYFIAELIEAATIFKEAMARLEKLISEEVSAKAVSRRRVRIVIGTVKGDVHDIGKTLVAIMLQAAGHEVVDLGVDVDADKFIDAVTRYNADVLAMSALLTTTARYMKTVVDRLKERGLRDKVFVIIGGAATTREFAEEVGADAWGRDAFEAVRIINELAERRTQGSRGAANS